MEILKEIKRIIAKSFFWAKIVNPEDISSPIVKAIREKEYETISPSEISQPIAEKLDEVREAVEKIEIPEPKEIVFPDNEEIINSLEELKAEIGKIEVKPQITVRNDLNRFLALFRSGRDKKEVLKALEDLKKSVEKIKIPESRDYSRLLEEIREKIENIKFPEFSIPEKLIAKDRIKVQVDRVGSGWGNDTKVSNKAGQFINPATEETLNQIDGKIGKLDENEPGQLTLLGRLKKISEDTDTLHSVLTQLTDLTNNVATQATLQVCSDEIQEINDKLEGVFKTTSPYNYIQSDEDENYKYYGYASVNGWKIKRKTLSTGVWETAEGTGDYESAWADRANKNYSYA